MFSSAQLKEIVAQVRPIIERQIDDALQIAAFRDVVSAEGGDWSALKALLKAQVQDERDESGDGKHIKKLLSKAEFASACADMLGLANMNEDNFSAGDDYGAETGGILDTESRPDGVPVASEADGPSGGYARHQSEPLSVPSAAQEAGDDDIAGECSSGRTESSEDGQTNSPGTASERPVVGLPEAAQMGPQAATREGELARTSPAINSPETANQSEAQPVEQSGQRRVDDGGRVEDRSLPVDATAPLSAAAAETGKPVGERDGSPAAPARAKTPDEIADGMGLPRSVDPRCQKPHICGRSSHLGLCADCRGESAVTA